MFGVLVCSHAGLAQGVVDALSMIMGEQPAFAAVGLDERDSLDELAARIKTAIDGFGCEKTIILTDLFGATPTNASSFIMFERDARVVTGVSLPAAIEAISHRNDEDFDAYCELVAVAGKEGVRHLTREIIMGAGEQES